MPSSIELRQQRARVVEQTRELVERAENENRDLSGEERQSYERLNEEFRSFTSRIERQEELERQELATAAPIPHPEDTEGRGHDRSRAGAGQAYRRSDLPEDDADRAHRMAFLDLVRYGRAGLAPEARALVEDANGEILVPEALEAEIHRALPRLTVMRNIASVRPISSNRVRRRSLDEVRVGWGKLETNEQDLTDSMPATPREEYTYVEDLYGLAKVGEDELMDSDVNLEQFIRDSFARAIAEAEDTAFVAGTGHAAHQPVGVATDLGGVPTVAAGQANGVTIDDFQRLIYALPAQARRNARFLTSSTTELSLSLLKDTTDRYLWQPSVQAGRPNTFLGYAIENQEDVAGIPGDGTQADVAVFGDFSVGYRIYDRLGMSLKRLEELYAEDGMVGFRVHRRVGGDVVNPDYLRRLRVPTAAI